MLQATALMSHVKTVSELVLIVAMELAAQKGCNFSGLHGVNRCSDYMLVDGLKVSLSLKDQISSKLCLHDTPMIEDTEFPEDRAVPFGKLVQTLMHIPDNEMVVGKILSNKPIAHFNEGVVSKLKADLLGFENSRQPIVAIEINLKAKRAPCGDAYIC